MTNMLLELQSYYRNQHSTAMTHLLSDSSSYHNNHHIRSFDQPVTRTRTLTIKITKNIKAITIIHPNI
ncbi:hypothetical protein DPEC_G00238620, partial [Dallia pectoralis]